MNVVRRSWFWADSAIMILRTYWFVLLSAGLTGPFAGPEFKDQFVLIITWLAIGFFLPLLFWNPKFMNPHGFILTEFFLIGGLCFYYMINLHQTTVMLLISSLIAGYLSQKKMIWWTCSLFVFIYSFTLFFIEMPFADVLNQTIYASIIYGTGLAVSFLIQSNLKTKQLMDLLEQKNAALTQYAKQIEYQTQLEEQNRLARELHDSLGHRFTSIAIGLDVAIHQIKTDADSSEQRLIKLRDYTKEGLDDVRRSIRQIAPGEDDLPLSFKLKLLIKDFAEYTSTYVNFTEQGDDNFLGVAIKHTLVRCLQELLTNAKRHGEATSISVSLIYVPSAVTLVVEDNGSGGDKLAAGFGLTSMKDRLENYGGNLQIESLVTGVRATCSVPLIEKGVKNE